MKRLKDTGKLIHIHLHYKMITGHQGMKAYNLPWAGEALKKRVLSEEYPVYTIDPTLETIVLHSRIGLKASNKKMREAKKPTFTISNDDIKELDYLVPKIEKERLDGILFSFFPKTKSLLKSLIFSSERNGEWFRLLYKCCKKDLQRYNKFYPFVRVVVRWYYYFLIRFRFVLRDKFGKNIIIRKSAGKSKGLIISFLGQDGAGKSTITDEVFNWLKWKLDVKKFYLGGGDNYSSIWKKLSIKLKGGHFNFLGRVFSIVDLYHLSKRVKRVTKKAYKYSQKGGIAIFDRYPQINYYGINDGPKIRCAANNKKTSKILRFVMNFFARREENNYKKAISVYPNLVFKLILPPEVSIQRKPEESLDAVIKKHEIIKKMSFEKSIVETIDATMDFTEEIKLIHGIIWDGIVSKMKEEKE